MFHDLFYSRDNRRHNFPIDIRQAHVAAGEAEGAFEVVHAEQVKDGGVQVVDVALVFDGFVAPVVGCAVGGAGLDAAAGEPDGEAEGIVVASVAALGEGGAAKFAGPDDQRVIQQAAACAGL